MLASAVRSVRTPVMWFLFGLCVAPTIVLAEIEVPADKEQLIELGRQHRTAWDLYKAFEEQADGGSNAPSPVPDWSGVYSRGGAIFNFDPDQGRNPLPTAKLTPEYQKRLTDKLERIANDIEFDTLSDCAP